MKSSTRQYPALPGMNELGELCAHRGLSARAADNKAEAVELAINEPAVRRLEFDVRQTKDGVLIIHHGAWLKGRLISHLTYARVMRQDPGILTLEQLVTQTAGRILLDMELKGAGYEQAALAVVRTRFELHEFVVTSFRRRVVRRLNQLAPEVSVGLLAGNYCLWQWCLRRPTDLLLPWRLGPANFVTISLQMTRWGVARRLYQAGIPTIVWNVDVPADVASVASLRGTPGIVSVVSNCPVGVVP